MKKLALLGLAILIVLALGCIGQKETITEKELISAEVKSTSVYAGTTIPILITLYNPYEVDLENVVVELTKESVPDPHQVSEAQQISKVLPGMERQVYLSITTSKDITVSQPITPRVKATFDATTNFYFDVNIINASNPDLLTKEYTAYSGSNNAPVTVEASNHERVEVTEETNWTVILNVKNNDDGRILSIKDLTLTVPAEGIQKAWLEFGSCRKVVYPSNNKITLTLKADDCSELSDPTLLNPNAVLTLVLLVKPPESVNVLRVEGHITYEYEVTKDLPTITIQKVG